MRKQSGQSTQFSRLSAKSLDGNKGLSMPFAGAVRCFSVTFGQATCADIEDFAVGAA